MKRFVTCFLSLLILLTASESFAWTIDYNIQERFAPQNAYCSRWISKQEAIDNVNADCESGDLGWYSRDPDYACRAIVTSDIDSCNAHSAVSAEYELVSYCEYPNVVNPATNECEPPPCESPNYVDVVSGECLAPRSVCFTSIHTEENECTYIGGEDPDDPDLPEGCTRNYNTGDLICVGDDTPAGEEANCYSVNGERFCPSPEAVCGNKNGTFSCIEPQEKGCGSFNGENVCVDPTGHVVPETSPDHPDNGGNLDGDDTNDLTDSRPPDQGGDPSNQPDSGTTTDGGASEKQQKLGNKELSEINKGIGGLSSDIKNIPGQLTETNNKTVGDYFNDVVEFGNEAIFGTGVDALIDGIDGNPMEGTGAANGVDGLGEGVLGFLPSGSCTTFSFSVGLASFQITCESSKRIRDILGFLLYAYTMMFMFNIVTDPVPAGEKIMAIQLLGIPFLAGVFGSVMSGLISFLAQFMTKRIAIVIAAIAAVVLVTGVFVGAISALVDAIQFSFPDYEYAFLFLPSNFEDCFGAIVAAKVLRWAYDWNIKIIQWKLF